MFNQLTNISDVASAGHGVVEEVKRQQRVSGFNSILCVASVPMARLYYQEFQRQMAADPTKKLRIATIYSYGANEAESDGILDEENSEDTSALDQSSRDFLDSAIRDYNELFHTNYSTDGDKFQNYYKDVSLRMKNKELDLLIVVNMFLTGFDATTLNTLWVDKNLKMHGLIQAFSRTNRILNSIKTFGNIVCFRNLQKRVDAAISLFGDKNAGGIVLLQRFDDYYHGYVDMEGKQKPGYEDMIQELTTKFPLSEPTIIGEQNQKDFIALFSAILRMRNLLSSFDEFAGKELISERDLQDYLGRYQDLRDEWRNKIGDKDKEDITDDVVFEVELIRQIEINIDYILMLVKKYHDGHCTDKEVLITIQKAIDEEERRKSVQPIFSIEIAEINTGVPGTAEVFNPSKAETIPVHRNFTLKIENVGAFPIRNVIIFDKYQFQLLKPNDPKSIQIAYWDSPDIKKWKSKLIEITDSDYERTDIGLPKWFNINYDDVDGHEMYQSFQHANFDGVDYYSLDETQEI